MKNKPVMIITGTSKGIGSSLVNYYIKEGFQVVGCSRSDVSFKSQYYKHYLLDITDEPQVKAMFYEIRKKYQRLDILINNAGVNNTLSPVLLVSLSSALKTIETNVIGTFLFSREAIKIMKLNSFGRIINFGSMALKHEVEGEAIYTASKAAVVSFSKILAKEIYGFGITCNVISPSAIETDLMSNIKNDALVDVLNRNAIKKIGDVSDIIRLIDYLIKPESKGITGQSVFLGGV